MTIRKAEESDGVEETGGTDEPTEGVEETEGTDEQKPAYVTLEQLRELFESNTKALLEKVRPAEKVEPEAPAKDAAEELIRVREEVRKLREEGVQAQRTNELLRVGLTDERYLPAVLAVYDGQENFKEFAARISVDKAFSGFFGKTASIPVERGRQPEAPAAGRGPAAKPLSSDAEAKADAERFYPNDPYMQKLFIQSRKTLKGGK